MRLGDVPSVEVTARFDAPPDVVWSLVSDVTRIGEWSPECRAAWWEDDPAGPEVGARFVGRQERAGVEWESVSTVTEAKPGRSFAWVVGDPAAPSASWRFDLAPDGAGTRVTQRAVIGPGRSSRLARRIEAEPEREEEIVAARLEEHRRNMAATLEGMKRALG